MCGEKRYPGQLVLQDVLTLDGRQFRDAAGIAASPPCQRYSYMHMPWKRGKTQAAEIRADESGRLLAELNALFDACFRIQRQASEAAGRYIPLLVENVVGAQAWVGPAGWHYGSFYLWGDIPALMPRALNGVKQGGSGSAWWDKAVDERRKSVTAMNTGRSPGGRKIAAAVFAEIPMDLAQWVARCWRP
jgi:hypothetical protein